MSGLTPLLASALNAELGDRARSREQGKDTNLMEVAICDENAYLILVGTFLIGVDVIRLEPLHIYDSASIAI